MSQRGGLRRWARRGLGLAGLVVTVAALVFVVRAVVATGAWARVVAGPGDLAVLGAAAAAYGVLSCLLSVGWWAVVRAVVPPPHGSSAPPSLGRLHRILATTQIGKYLPGNLFHYLGRVVAARAAGLPAAAVAASLVIETALLIAAAALVGAAALLATGAAGLSLSAGLGALPALPDWAARFAGAPGTVAPVAVAVAVGVGLGAIAVGAWVRPRGGGLGWLGVAAVSFAMFFAGCGLLLGGLAVRYAGANAAPIDPATMVATAAAAWLIGFVTPGAAAGVGVREAVLILLLTGPLDPGAAATVALGFRLATLLGDVVFLATGLPGSRTPAAVVVPETVAVRRE